MHSNKANVIKCIIVNTSPTVIDTIKSYLNRIEYIELVASFNNPIDVISFLNKKKIDLAFLDERLCSSNWINISKKINHLPQIIFTSNNAKFRLEAFKLNATYYLTKSIEFSDFLKGIHKVENRFKRLNPTTANMVSAGTIETKKEEDIILIKTEHENYTQY
jgi:two-component SAPR family response regulator